VVLAALSVTTVAATPINVAFGKPVSLSGTFGVGGGDPVSCSSPVPPSAAGSTLVDGLFLQEGTCWQTGTVWWDTGQNGSTQNTVEIDLEGLYKLDGFMVQADCNDTFRLEYRDAGGNWQTGWDIPMHAPDGVWNRTTTLPAPVVGSALRFFETGGDGYYSVSEIQAFGQPVPEPSTALLLAGGGALLASIRRVLSRRR